VGLLDAKVAIVTGAGNGIGRATALRFATEGAQVVVNDLGCTARGEGSDAGVAADVAREIEQAGGHAVSSTEDAATRDGAARIVECALDAFGRLDVLVNSAGVARDQPLLETDTDAWDAVLRAPLQSTLLCTQAAALHLSSHGGGRIVNTVGRAGLIGSLGKVSEAVGQAGVYGLTRSAAIELQRHGITVNAVAPIARTRLTAEDPALDGQCDLTPEHVAAAILFLASDLCGNLSGCVLAVGGGRLSTYRVVESRGRFKGGDTVWTPEEIAEHWESIAK
jgi:NAD(P)-dependent dehydrogenase (short-subunit alcohol dehydrogenase family)